MNFKSNFKKFNFLIINFLFIIFLYFYSFDFLFSNLNNFLSQFKLLWFYQICENSINLYSNTSDVVSYRFTNNLQCVGQVLNNYEDGTFHVGVSSESLLINIKSFFLFLDIVLFIFIFYPKQLKKLAHAQNTRNKIVTSKITKYVTKVNKIYILWSFLFFNFIYINFLRLIFSELEFFNYSKLNYLTQVSLQVFLMILFLIVFYLISKLRDKNIIKFLALFLFIAYPINKMFLVSDYLVLLSSLIFSFLLIKIGRSEITKNILFTFLFLLTIFNSFTAFNLLNQNILSNQSNLPDMSNLNQVTNSAEGPILILWFDEFPSYTIFSEELNIRSEYKNLSSLSNQSYIFPFNQALASSSYESLNLTFSEFKFDENIINKYDIKFIEPISNICPYKDCNYSKRLTKLEYLKDLIAILLNILDYNFLNNFIPNIDDRFGDFWIEKKQVVEDYWEVDFKTLNNLTMNISKNDFIFAHIFLPHTPWKYFSNGETYSMQPDNSRSFFLNDEYKWKKQYENKSFIIDESSRQINQILYLDSLIGEIISNLKKQKLYEEATIIIASDHGINVSKNGAYRSLNDTNYTDILNTPLIIKTPNQNINHKMLNVVGNQLIADFLKVLLENQSNEEQFQFLANYNKTPNIKILSWDNLMPNSNKYQINDGYVALNKDIFINNVKKNTELTSEVFHHIENNYGWSAEPQIALSNLNEINFNRNNINLDSSNKYFYVNSAINSTAKQVLIENNQRFKIVDTYIDNNQTRITFVLDSLVSSDVLLNMKIYEIEK